MEWWIEIAPDVVAGLSSFGFLDPPPGDILQSVADALGAHTDHWRGDRWPACPDDFFVYSHAFLADGRFHELLFVVKDTTAEAGILRIAWVEHHPGAEFQEPDSR